jgi:hypothetical protein
MELFAPLERAFYDTPSAAATQQWHDWLLQWSQALDAEGERGGAKERMDQANPKYVPREWMLVQAYEMAAKGDRSVSPGSMIALLHGLCKAMVSLSSLSFHSLPFRFTLFPFVSLYSLSFHSLHFRFTLFPFVSPSSFFTLFAFV